MSQSREAQVLRLVADVCGLLDISEFRHGLLDALNRALPSKYVSLNEIGPTPDTVVTIVRPEFAPEYHERFAQHAHENPLLQRYLRSRDGRAYRFSDVISPADLHRLALYRELYKPLGLEHQLAFTLPAAPDRVLAVALARGKRDYSDLERDVADHARPFLIQAYRNAIAYELLRSESPDEQRRRARPSPPRGGPHQPRSRSTTGRRARTFKPAHRRGTRWHQPPNRRKAPRAQLPQTRRQRPLERRSTRMGTRLLRRAHAPKLILRDRLEGMAGIGATRP